MSDERTAVRAYFHWKNGTGRDPKSETANWQEACADEALLLSLPGSRRWPHTVVDQNMLRSSAVLDAQGGPFLLPDVGPAELLKGNDWRYVAERTLPNLVRRAESVHVAYSIGDILRHEMASGELGELVDPVATSAFQHFLQKASASVTGAFDEYKTAIEDGRRLAASQYFDAERNRETVINARDGWLHELYSSDLKVLRQPGGFESELAHRLLSDTEMLATVALLLKNADYDDATAKSLAFCPSLTGSHCLGLIALALQWITRGGLDASTSGNVLTNDIADLDYVVASIFCRGYLSTEKKMISLRGVLDRALNSLWSDNAEYLLLSVKKEQREAV